MAVLETNKKHDFDLDHVYETLKRCKQKDEYVNIDEYLLAYHELCRYVFFFSHQTYLCLHFHSFINLHCNDTEI